MKILAALLALSSLAHGAGPAALAISPPASTTQSSPAPSSQSTPKALGGPAALAPASDVPAPSTPAPAKASPTPLAAAPVSRPQPTAVAAGATPVPVPTEAPRDPAVVTGAAPAPGSASEPQPTPQISAASGSPAPASVSSIAQAWGHSGFLYSFSVSNWNVFNGSPLAYTPFEFGYDFGNGLRVQSGIDLLYYQGNDTDDKNPAKGVQKYDYEMSNWRTSLYYRFPLPIRLRPLAALSLNAFGGSRRLAKVAANADGSGPDINAGASKFAAWSYIGVGGLLGLEYLLNADWSLQLSGRYDFTFTSVASPVVSQLGVAVTF